MPDRIDTLLYGLADEAARVSLGSERCVDGMRYTPVRSLYEEALRLIRAWQGRHPAPPTLEDLMLAFIADYPNGHLNVRHDPLRTSGQWTATAYRWRGDGDSPAEAIERLRARVVSNTISVLPPLDAAQHWTRRVSSLAWTPTHHRLFQTTSHYVRVGEPPPLEVIFDPTVRAERLYVPVKA